MDLWHHLANEISQATQQPFTFKTHSSIGGGCINESCRITDGQQHYFVKLNQPSQYPMFEAEAQALIEMAASETIRVPGVICYGHTREKSYLVLEYLELGGHIDSVRQGHELANMHRVSAKHFGWHRDNTIGSTPQYNKQSDNWVSFWREQRLIPQLKLAEQNGYGPNLSAVCEKLISRLDALFETYQPQPSMLHGDLWGGNASSLEDSTPVIFDPALYFGDREADLAMTRLFGGFDTNFYAAYQETWPLDEGFSVRKSLYNQYHMLNHLNLFGSGYLGSAISLAEQVLSEI